ncbi:MAG: hypothetical protein RLZZ221_1673, partial [Verrucomicrobiota bacterium]
MAHHPFESAAIRGCTRLVWPERALVSAGLICATRLLKFVRPAMSAINRFLLENNLRITTNPCVSPDFCLDWPALRAA